MVKTITFHSSRGGTGKTTIASNLSAFLAKRGYTVCLLDLDINAPSLDVYFEKEPKIGINDFLFSERSTIDDIMIDLSPMVNENKYEGNHSNSNSESFIPKDQQVVGQLHGKLLVGFNSTNREEKDDKDEDVAATMTKEQCLRRLILFHELLKSIYDPDYIIIDAAFSMTYWSINAMAIADISILILKMADIDIKGTKNIVTACYDSFKKNGCKWFLLCNKVAGYCTPQNQTMMPISHVNTTKTYYDDNYSYAHAHSKKRSASSSSSSSSSLPSYYYSQEHLAEQYGETDIENALYKELGIKPICTIPCYCDIQFSKKEFLTSIQYPYHSFSRKIKTLANSIQQEAKNI